MMRITSALAFTNRVLWTFAFTFVEITSCLHLAQAQLNSNLQIIADQQKPPVTDRPPRSERKPAASRGSCEETDAPFTPVLPVTDGRFTGFTLKEHPAFWFYVPYQMDNVNSGEFTLEDQQGNVVSSIRFRLPETPGFVSVSLPVTKAPLEMDMPYRWAIRLDCAEGDSYGANYAFAEGWVQRVNLADLEAQLEAVSLEERLDFYLNNRIWYDALTDLAEIRNRPQVWQRFLTEMELEQLEREAIADSVVPIE